MEKTFGEFINSISEQTNLFAEISHFECYPSNHKKNILKYYLIQHDCIRNFYNRYN